MSRKKTFLYSSFEAALRNVVVAERVLQGYTQSTFARAIGWSQANLSDVECGRRGIGMRALVRIARELKIPIYELVRRAEMIAGA